MNALIKAIGGSENPYLIFGLLILLFVLAVFNYSLKIAEFFGNRKQMANGNNPFDKMLAIVEEMKVGKEAVGNVQSGIVEIKTSQVELKGQLTTHELMSERDESDAQKRHEDQMSVLKEIVSVNRDVVIAVKKIRTGGV